MSKFFKLSLSLFALSCSPFKAYATPVVDYFETAAKSKLSIPPKTAQKLLKDAKPIARDQLPPLLKNYFSAFDSKTPILHHQDQDGRRLFFANEPLRLTGQCVWGRLSSHGWHNDGVSLWNVAHGAHLRLATLPADLSKVWAQLDKNTAAGLGVTRPALRGRSLARDLNPVGYVLEPGNILDAHKLRALRHAIHKNHTKLQTITAEGLPAFLRGFLQNHKTPQELQQTGALEYYKIREEAQTFYISIPRGAALPKGLLSCLAYDEIALWRHKGGKMRIAAMPIGRGTGLGQKLAIKTLAHLGVTDDDFPKAKPVRPTPSKGKTVTLQAPKASATPKPKAMAPKARPRSTPARLKPAPSRATTPSQKAPTRSSKVIKRRAAAPKKQVPSKARPAAHATRRSRVPAPKVAAPQPKSKRARTAPSKTTTAHVSHALSNPRVREAVRTAAHGAIKSFARR